jgi:hypothetical protein
VKSAARLRTLAISVLLDTMAWALLAFAMLCLAFPAVLALLLGATIVAFE